MSDRKRRRLLRKLARLEQRRDVFEWWLPPSWAGTQERIWRLRERLGLPLSEEQGVDAALREALAAFRAEANDPTRLRPTMAREAEHRFLDDMEAGLGLGRRARGENDD